MLCRRYEPLLLSKPDDLPGKSRFPSEVGLQVGRLTLGSFLGRVFVLKQVYHQHLLGELPALASPPAGRCQ
jgi:hypothetical protein